MTGFDWFMAALAYLGIGTVICAHRHLNVTKGGPLEWAICIPLWPLFVFVWWVE